MFAKKQKTLALFGGKPVLAKSLRPIHNIDQREIKAAIRVLRQGPLSGFLASASNGFLGGREVRKLEAFFARKFKINYAVSFNSATTALHAAIVALGIGPGDEVIVPPYTMSASASAVLANGAVPIFADIDDRTFCVNPDAIARCVTKRTKAIIAVNLFGGSADYRQIRRIARKYKLSIIEDNAQAPGARYFGKYTGTIGDIGVFSFNIHKTMQTGEGGILVTNKKTLALRARLARNHGEVVVDQMPHYSAGPIIGSNYRMTELVAALAYEQVKKLDNLNQKRLFLVHRLARGLSGIKGLILPKENACVRHVYYRYPIKINERMLGISRDRFVEAMRAEGFLMPKGYVKPIYLLPVFQQQKAFNNTHFPFKSNYYKGRPDYRKGICPAVERLQEHELTLTDICQHPYTKKHVDLFVSAVKKIIAHKSEL
ncbi:MAG: DegT/DnrJ/EryC1/StrS family aminotransferase [Parcubacteria group bacterium]